MKVVTASFLLAYSSVAVGWYFGHSRNRFGGGHNFRSLTTRSNHQNSDLFRHRTFSLPSRATGHDALQTQANLDSQYVMEAPSQTTVQNSQNPLVRPYSSSAASRLADLSYLDPQKFRSPILTLREMEHCLREIEKYTGHKDKNKTDDYTGSRVLVQLLREQCFRQLPSADNRITTFCSQFGSRISTFL